MRFAQTEGVAPVRHQRPLDVVMVALTAAAVAVIAAYDRLGHAAMWSTTGITWLCWVVGVVGLRRFALPRSSPWWFGVHAIMAVGCADTLLLALGKPHAPITIYPPAAIAYFVAYALGLWGLISHTRRWSKWHHATVAVDGFTFTVGILTIFGTVAYSQLRNPTLGPDARINAIIYPLLDALLVSFIGRLWFGPGRRLSAVRIVTLAPMFLVAEHSVDLLRLSDPGALGVRWTQVWILMMVGLAWAVTRPSVTGLPTDGGANSMNISLAQASVLGVSLLIPPLMLVGYGRSSQPIPWPPLAAGGLLMATLVALRVGLLVREVQRQTARVELMARSDPLTGAANRRRWEHAVAECFAHPVEPGAVAMTWVGIMDLDNFKRFNDTYGHQEGDHLLRAAVAAWTDILHPGELLARYGGEEFTVMLPGLTAGEAEARADALRAAMPMGQTCSVGLAARHPGDGADAVMRAADNALYAAKRGGRDRVVVAPTPGVAAPA